MVVAGRGGGDTWANNHGVREGSHPRRYANRTGLAPSTIRAATAAPPWGRGAIPLPARTWAWRWGALAPTLVLVVVTFLFLCAVRSCTPGSRRRRAASRPTWGTRRFPRPVGGPGWAFGGVLTPATRRQASTFAVSTSPRRGPRLGVLPHGRCAALPSLDVGEVALVPLLTSVALVEVTCRAVLVFAPWLFALPSFGESLTELSRSSSRRCRFLPKPVWVCPSTVRRVTHSVVNPRRTEPRSHGKGGTPTRTPLLHL